MLGTKVSSFFSWWEEYEKSLIAIIILTLLITIMVCYSTYLDRIKYDILIEEHRYEYEEGMLQLTGYATNYYYTIINSEKLEKYIATYCDVWSVHNENGKIDTVNIKKESINKIELADAINKIWQN